MAEPHVISALKEKRAELAGELHQAELRLVRIRRELLAIDGALRVFDPTITPHAIRPITRRGKPTRFRHGDFTRLIKDVLRRSSHPMSCRAIAEQIAVECDVNLPDVGAATAFTNKVRNALARRQDGLTCERESVTGAVLWRVASGESGH
jgi:hypothetical protein